MSALSPASAVVVRRWIDAFNARDLDELLECLHPDVDFCPLRVDGVGGAYTGHGGVRRWFTQLVEARHEHRIELSEVRAASDDQILAVGALSAVPGLTAALPMCALHRLRGEQIISAHHYFTSPHVLESFDPFP